MPQIIIALDVSSIDEASGLIMLLGEDKWYKIGLELIYTPGSHRLVRNLPNVFLDAKLDDIPTTVRRTCRQIAREWQPKLLSVRRHVEDALEGVEGYPRTKIVHVPNLTSDSTATAVFSRAWGVVCRPSLASVYRAKMPWIRTIVPGIRPPGAQKDDHVETTPECLRADYVVIGRPITRSKDPRAALYAFEKGEWNEVPPYAG